MKKNIYTLKTEFILPPHEQTILADYPADFNIFSKVIGSNIANGLKKQLEENMEELPIHRWDEFDDNTHNNHYFAEMYVVSKELIEEYKQLKENSTIK